MKKSEIVQVRKRRLYAYFLDLFIIYFISKSMYFSLTLFVKKILIQLPGYSEHILSELSYFSGIIRAVVFISYFSTWNYLNQGQTISKLLFGIRIVNEDNNAQMEIADCIKRSVVKLFSDLLLFPYIFIFLRPDGKGVHDQLSNSSVLLSKSKRIILKKDQYVSSGINNSEHQLYLFDHDESEAA